MLSFKQCSYLIIEKFEMSFNVPKMARKLVVFFKTDLHNFEII